ncbi:MAG: sodium:alanine symporter family protein [Verrucomicrobiota bacterium]
MAFAEIEQALLGPLNVAVSWLWGPILVYLLLGTHLFMTIRLGFIQRFLPKMIRLSVKPTKREKGDISGFGALTTALAATIGAGNIIGVAGAILTGGPGAVLWMWLTGVFGIATKYSECLLALKYRTVNSQGQISGGPMYVLERGLKAKWLGVMFAAFAVLAGFGIGNMFQANAVAGLMNDNLGLPHWTTGLVLVGLVASVTFGGVRSIARVAEFLVPIMAGLYILGCLVLLVLHFDAIPNAFYQIITQAFFPEAAAGGAFGAILKATVEAGVARGLFSNEAGLGSAPIVASAAQTPNSVRQAMVSASGTFWDTVVICLISAVVIISSGAYVGETDRNLVTNNAFDDMGTIGPFVLTFALSTFAFSTILGWSYYGEKALEYLAGVKAIIFYRFLWLVVVFLGCITGPALVGAFCDLMNGLMALPNLIGVLLLSGVVAAETRKYIRNPEQEDPDFTLASKEGPPA